MLYVLVFFVGLVQGAVCLFLYLMSKHRQVMKHSDEVEAQKASLAVRTGELQAADHDLAKRKTELELERQTLSRDLEVAKHELAKRAAAFERERQQTQESLARKQQELMATAQREIDLKNGELAARAGRIEDQRREWDRRIISYDELKGENAILKRDLQNIDVNVNKLQLDIELQAQRQTELDARSRSLAERYLAETVKATANGLTPLNFGACKQRLLDVIVRCREIGFEVPADKEQTLVADLKARFERVVKIAIDREEQARITAQIREEQRLQREVDRELKQLEREKAAIRAALDQALAAAKDQHTAEVEKLEVRLAEAEAKSQRAISMAQQTKAGYVYVISNIGSFGEQVFKVGMTRRLEPLERVNELGNASVPFPYDVHMMIKCDDAPSLENALHRELHRQKINKVNPRKEFFKTDLESIRHIVEQHHDGEVLYTIDPEALEYRQSLTISDEDSEYIERVYDEADESGVDVDQQ